MYYVQSFFGHTRCVVHKWVFPSVNCKYVSIRLYSKETKTEDSGRLGYDTVIGWVFYDILKDYNAFILRQAVKVFLEHQELFTQLHSVASQKNPYWENLTCCTNKDVCYYFGVVQNDK